MQDILQNVPDDSKRTRLLVATLALLLYLGFFAFLSDGGSVDFTSIQSVDPIYLLIVQGVLSLFIFVGFSLIFSYLVFKLPPGDFFQEASIKEVGILFLLAISFLIAISPITEWNMNVVFPNEAFEAWARRSEEGLQEFTAYLTDFQSIQHFVVGLIVIAVLPGIGEELLFRGLLQNVFQKTFNNPHVAIWSAAFIFGAIHMQFYGLVPRMLLGVLFGYLYHWSGNLLLPVIAHLMNNAFVATMLYAAKLSAVELTMEQMDASAPWPMVVVGALVAAYLLFFFYKKYSLKHE